MYDDDEQPQYRQWRWSALLVELTKLPVGITYALMTVAQTIASMADGIHGDVVAHHNHKIYQAHLREEMALTLEKL